MPDALVLGPLVLPVWITLIVGGWAALAIARRVLASRDATEHGDSISAAADGLTTAAILAFLAWKLAPILSYPDMLLTDLVSLLRLPGGRVGLVLAGLIAAAYLTAGGLRHRELVVPGLKLTAAATLGVLIAFGALNAAGPGTSSDAPAMGVADTQVTLLSADGSTQTVPLYRHGHPTMLTFWATWCGPCRAEIPVKRQAWEYWGSDVTMRAVNMTRTEAGADPVAAYLEQHDITYPVALDEDGRLSDRYAVRGTPTTVVLGADGNVLDRWVGPSSLDRIERALARARTETIAPD